MRWWEMGLPGYDAETVSPMGDIEDEPEPSIMRQLLAPDEAERLEIEPGRWYLPGTPP